MIKRIKPKHTLLMLLMCFVPFLNHAQSLKEKMKAKFKKDKSEIYECGYVFKPGLKDKLNPMKALQKGLAAGMTDASNPDIGTSAISIFYQANLHPQSIMRYPTKTPGWKTCGDAVFAGFTNRNGTGLSSTDGSFLVNSTSIEYAGAGTFFHGFDASKRGLQTVLINSSNGKSIEVPVKPAAPLAIVSVDGIKKGEMVAIDGTKDIVIELLNGDADPTSSLHVQLVCKLAGTPIIYDVIVTKARNTIYIPKEAFKNFEGSPSPFTTDNTLIINRVQEEIIHNTDAGALRTISAYMDWMPITVSGDIAKGSIMTNGFDESKNTNISVDLSTTGEYNFSVSKSQPFTAPPVKLMKDVAVASFVVRANLDAKDVSTQGNWIVETTKWFPELEKDTWQKLCENLYAQFAATLKQEMKMQLRPLSEVVAAEAYRYAKPMQDEVTKNLVEVGAGGTKRILTSTSVDFFQDLSITFGGDFVSQRLVKELQVDAVVAVTIDLNFNFETEGLDPQVSIVAFAPDVSYKTQAKFFSMSANTASKSLSESRQFEGPTEVVLSQMIKSDLLIQEFAQALKELSQKEDQYPVYEALWKAKF